MLFMSIQYAFVVYMVGLPTRINKTSLSEEPFISIAVREYSYKGACVPVFASSCFHYHGDYVSAEKNFSFPPIPLCHESRDFLYVYDLVYSLGEFLASPLLKITFAFWVAGKGRGIGRLKRQGGSGHEMWKKAQSKSPFCLEEVKGTIPHLCLNWGLESKPRNMCSPLSERMGEMRRHITEAMITASSMRANVVFMTA